MGEGDYEGEYDPIVSCCRCSISMHIDEARVMLHGDRQEIVCYPCAHPSLFTKIARLFGGRRR